MEERYDASGYGWDDDDKNHMLGEDGARFLLVRERDGDNEQGKLVAFAHFRFSVQGEVAEQMCGAVSIVRHIDFYTLHNFINMFLYFILSYVHCYITMMHMLASLCL